MFMFKFFKALFNMTLSVFQFKEGLCCPVTSGQMFLGLLGVGLTLTSLESSDDHVLVVMIRSLGTQCS